MSDGLIKATWTCGYSVQLPDGTVVNPGDTALIPAGEAQESGNWKPVRPKDPQKPAAPVPSPAQP